MAGNQNSKRSTPALSRNKRQRVRDSNSDSSGEDNVPPSSLPCHCPRHAGQRIQPHLRQRCEFARDMAALRRGAPHLNASFAQGSTSNNITPGLHSAAASLDPNPVTETSILDTLQAATAPYRVDEPSTDSVLPLDLDTIMANVGLANDLDGFPLVTTHHTDDLLPDVTLPQLPSMMYGVELLPEESVSDNGGDMPAQYSPRSEYSDLADISDLEDDSELFHSDMGSTHVEQLGQPAENIANPSYTNAEVPPIPPHIPADTTDEQAGIPISPIPPHIRFYESLALDLHGRFGLTRAGVEYMLKSIDWSLGDTGVVGPRSKSTQDSPPGLSKTLPALLKRARIESFGDKYAVCPNIECNHIVPVSTIPWNAQSYCEECNSSLMKPRRQRVGAAPQYTPKLTFTYHSLIEQLKRLLSRREIVLAIRNHKAHLNRPDRDRDTKEDIQHGRIWSEMKGPDGKAFFTPDGDEIGLILALDWFNSTTMVGSRSHSTGVISMAMANLPPELRWNPENVILIGTIPGPVETKTDQLANFLDPLVDELLVLWNTPQTILPTEPSECVRQIKAALVICICDAPAARKLSGTQGVTDHEARTIVEHRKAATTYQTLRTDTERAEFMKTRTYFDTPGGYRHVALLKLPYWNGARMVVVDPMHCIFLGIVKWQLKNIWVKFQHMREGDGFEIDMLHDIIQSAQLPDFLGRPPPHTGTKQGGSLTADQLRTLISVIFPIAIPVIWDTIDQASADQRALEEYRRQKVEHARLVAEREAMKRALGTNAPALPPLPNTPRAPRRPKKGKRQLPTRAP
ncbi:Transposase family Tnp2 domain-containing protein [Ceratobasidium sp. AG-Ba]|nr:Transposase family Tnp2 domain-containing protein [Ceratobasidium sp. AG-Ba]